MQNFTFVLCILRESKFYRDEQRANIKTQEKYTNT